MNCTLYCIRHDESVSNAGGMTMEHNSISLSDKGKHQAQVVAVTLDVKPSQVLVSGLIRAQQTAQPFCDKHHVSYQVNPLLNEIHAISHELIGGMSGERRRPIAQVYWAKAMSTRAWANIRIISKSSANGWRFIDAMAALPDNSVIFGYRICLRLLV